MVLELQTPLQKFNFPPKKGNFRRLTFYTVVKNHQKCLISIFVQIFQFDFWHANSNVARFARNFKNETIWNFHPLWFCESQFNQKRVGQNDLKVEEKGVKLHKAVFPVLVSIRDPLQIQ